MLSIVTETCNICGEPAGEFCPDGNCRACHKSLSWSDCVDGTWNVQQMLEAGHTEEEARRVFPDAKQWQD